MTKKIKKEFSKMPKRFMALTMIIAMLISYVVPITSVFATVNTTSLSVSFRVNDNVSHNTRGKVMYSLNDGATWEEITEDGVLNNIQVTGDNLKIRLVPNSGYEVDYWGTELWYGDTKQNNIDEWGLENSSGFSIPANIESVSIANLEFREGENGPENNFDGRAYVVWSCGTGVCYHEFTNLPPTGAGSTFYRNTEIEADNKTGTYFDVHAQYIGWYLADEFTVWQELYEVATGNPVNWNTLNPELVIGEPNQHISELVEASGCEEGEEQERCVNLYGAQQGQIWTHKLQPVGEPSANNAHISYGDRNFKVVIYNEDFKAVSRGDFSELHYYPATWTNEFIRQDMFDVSGTSKNNPATMDSILLESTVTVRALNYNSFEITSIEALDVPDDAVAISQKPNGDFELVFSSNYYDNVVFKLTDNHEGTSYLLIKRTTIDGWIRRDNDQSILTADFYFDRDAEYTDFDMTAKIIHKDGTTRNVTLAARFGVGDGLDNDEPDYEVDLEHPQFGPAGKGLKKSVFEVNLEPGEEENIKDVYLNVEYKGSTSSVYAGAYVGSGEGTLANIYHGEEEQ